MFHAAALRTGLVSQGQSMPTKPRKNSRSAEAVRRDDQFVLQTSAVTWEILLFVLTEEGVSRDLFERELRNSKPQVTVDDHSFLKAVDTIRNATKLLLRDNGDEMRQLSIALNTSDGHLYSSYLAMAQSAIGSDIRWGRIVALMGFTGIVAARLAKEHEAEKVGSLLGWERTFMCETCHDWIEDCGGWKSVSAHFRSHSAELEDAAGNVSTTTATTQRHASSWWLAPLTAGLFVVGALLKQ